MSPDVTRIGNQNNIEQQDQTMTDRVYRKQARYDPSQYWKYDDTDLEPSQISTHYIETIREVVKPITIRLWTYHESYENEYNSITYPDPYYTKNSPHSSPSIMLSEFLCRTEVGIKIAELGVPVSVEKHYKPDTMSTVHYIFGHFTSDTHREFEKFQMIQKLSGKQL